MNFLVKKVKSLSISLASTIILFSLFILSDTSLGGVTFFSGRPSILCILYFLLKTFFTITSNFWSFIIRIVMSFFLSLPIPKTNWPSLVTRTSLLSILTFAPGLVCPRIKDPWLNYPVKSTAYKFWLEKISIKNKNIFIILLSIHHLPIMKFQLS